MDAKKLGAKIRSERNRLGLTQDIVEKRLELPQKALTRMESGERPPSSLELVKLAEVFHVSVGSFFNEEATDDPLVALHRAAPGLEKDPVIREEVYRCLNLCREGIALEKLLTRPSRQRFSVQSSHMPLTTLEAIKQGEEAGRYERNRLGLGIGVIHDIAGLISSQGIWCAATNLPEGMSGLFLSNQSIGMAILVNANHVKMRQRFSYAHEYAHALLDTDHPVLVSEIENARKLIEQRANAFAAAFLLPEEGIAEVMKNLNKGAPSRISFCFYDVSTEEMIEGEERQLAKSQKILPQDVATIAHRFGVSYEAVVYRLHTLRYLSKESRETLLKQKEEGNQFLRLFFLEDSDERPQECVMFQFTADLSRLILEAYRQEKISRGRVIELSKLLRLHPQDLLNLASDE
jgi:Zn-dependent peptidase ImmA (M78 family)/transcriptional regulator with XRE-family HTH domain